MANTFHIRGVAALLRWDRSWAATLGAWTVEGAPGAWTFTAVVVEQDHFRVSQRPLLIVTPTGWRWPVEPDTLQIADGTLTASIRPQERSDGLMVCPT